MMRKTICCITLVFATKAFGYEVETNKTISEHAINASSLATPTLLQQIGLRGVSPFDGTQKYRTFKSDSFSFNESLSIGDLIKFGAGYEDDRRSIQAIHHFFNPVNGQQLTIPEWAGSAEVWARV